MANAKDTITKPLTTVQLILAVLQLAEKILPAFLLALVDFSRMKQKKAEDRVAYYESKEKADAAKAEIDKQVAGKSSADIIREHLASK